MFLVYNWITLEFPVNLGVMFIKPTHKSKLLDCNCFIISLILTLVRATTGTIGGSLSHEYHIPAAVGEDTLITCLR